MICRATKCWEHLGGECDDRSMELTVVNLSSSSLLSYSCCWCPPQNPLPKSINNLVYLDYHENAQGTVYRIEGILLKIACAKTPC